MLTTIPQKNLVAKIFALYSTIVLSAISLFLKQTKRYSHIAMLSSGYAVLYYVLEGRLCFHSRLLANRVHSRCSAGFSTL